MVVFVCNGNNPVEEKEVDVWCTCVTACDAVDFGACYALTIQPFQRPESVREEKALQCGEGVGEVAGSFTGWT